MYYEKKKKKNSHLLGNRFRVGKIPWNKGKQGVQKVTEETKAKLRKINLGNQHAKGSKRSEEHKKICKEANTKENHWNWQGGKSKDKRTGTEYIDWRTKVFQRDNWTCQTCRKRGCYIEAHHIKSWAKFPELRLNIENGVTLCLGCHKLTDNYKGRKHELLHNHSDNKDIPNDETD